MKKKTFTLAGSLSLILLFTCCTKEPMVESIGTWKNDRNMAHGEINGAAWSGTAKLNSDGKMLAIDISKYVLPDSLLISSLTFRNIPIRLGLSELVPYSDGTNKPFTFYFQGDGDVYDFFKILTLPSERNEVEITAFDLKKGVIKGKINATYTYDNGPFHTKENIYVKDLVFNYQR